MAPSVRGPVLLGQPSPSLRTMQRMTQAELAEHLQRLREHAGHVELRIGQLRSCGGSNARLARLIEQHERLLALMETGRRLRGRTS